jgi:hypothetical protein
MEAQSRNYQKNPIQRTNHEKQPCVANKKGYMGGIFVSMRCKVSAC